MSVASDDQILRELTTEARKWTMRIFPLRMSASGAEEVAVRQQMQADAEKWVQENFELLKQGKEAKPLPTA